MNKPTVSIIIPVFNRAHLIADTLNSVLAQTYRNWECVIVDDGSNDNPEKIIDSFISTDSRFRFYHRPNIKRKGANSCRNYGVEKCNGDFFLFLDSDDILKKDCLEMRLNIFKKYPNLDFAVFSMGVLKNNHFKDAENPKISNNREELLSLFITGPLPWNMTRPLWKKNFFLEKEGFNENLDMFDDDEFNFRVIHDINVKFIFVDYTDCFYRIYSENVLKYQESKFIEKFFKSHYLFLNTMNKVLTHEEKITLKEDLKKNIYITLGTYFNRQDINKNLFKSNILFHFKNFKSSWDFKFFIFAKFLFWSYPLEMKGRYKINNFLNRKIEKAINKK